MTRINTISPQYLSDQHLLVEIHEIPRVPTLALKRLRKGTSIDASDRKYTLGSGHVIFFYDKILYLWQRINALNAEAIARGFDNKLREDDGRWSEIRDKYPQAWNNWNETRDAKIENLSRLNAKIISSTVDPRYCRQTRTKEDFCQTILNQAI